MKITREWLQSCSTSPLTGSFTDEQIDLLGQGRNKGWLSKSVGKDIPDEIANRIAEIGRKGRSRVRYMIPPVLDLTPVLSPKEAYTEAEQPETLPWG